MSAASNYLEEKLLNHTLTATAFTQPAARYLALFKDVAGGIGTIGRLEEGTLSDEITTAASAYIRKVVTFAAATNPGGVSATNATVTFDAATINWGTITHIAVMDAVSAGNVLFYGAVTTPKTIETGDTFQVSSGNLTVTLA